MSHSSQHLNLAMGEGKKVGVTEERKRHCSEGLQINVTLWGSLMSTGNEQHMGVFCVSPSSKYGYCKQD